VDAAVGIPLPVPVGDEAICDVRCLPDECDFFSDDLHRREKFVSCEYESCEWVRWKAGEWGSGIGDELISRTHNSSTHPLPTLPLTHSFLSDEFYLGRCGDYADVRFSLSKKKGERHHRADRGISEFGGERQYHCRVPARFGNKVNRMVGDRTRLGVRRLPRGRDLVRCRGIGEVGAADGNLRVGVDFLVLGTAHALQMLNRGADARVVNAVPVELARLAAQIRLDLCADVDFVVGSDHARLRIALSRQHGVDAKPAVEGDVASILAECLHSFKKTAHNTEVRVELTSDNVAVVHGEAQTARGVVRFLVCDEETEDLLRRVAWINPGYHPVVEGRLWSRGYYGCCHNLFPLFTSPWVRRPMRFPATRSDPLSELQDLPIGTAHIVSKYDV